MIEKQAYATTLVIRAMSWEDRQTFIKNINADLKKHRCELIEAANGVTLPILTIERIEEL